MTTNPLATHYEDFLKDESIYERGVAIGFGFSWNGAYFFKTIPPYRSHSLGVVGLVNFLDYSGLSFSTKPPYCNAHQPDSIETEIGIVTRGISFSDETCGAVINIACAAPQ